MHRVILHIDRRVNRTIHAPTYVIVIDGLPAAAGERDSMIGLLASVPKKRLCPHCNPSTGEAITGIGARDTATILAALRLRQDYIESRSDGASGTYEQIASDGGTHKPLTSAEIDLLCEQLNGTR